MLIRISVNTWVSTDWISEVSIQVEGKFSQPEVRTKDGNVYVIRSLPHETQQEAAERVIKQVNLALMDER